MSDLEDSDIEENEESKSTFIPASKIDSKNDKTTISKKVLTELKNNSDIDDDDDDDDDDVEQEVDLDEDTEEGDDDYEDEDVIGIDESEFEKITNEKKMDKTYIQSSNLPEDTYITDVSPINSDVESDDEDYLQKIDEEMREKYINDNHPECLILNSVEIDNLCQIKRDSENNIIDDNHKTAPFLSKFEKTKVIGQRIKQLNIGDRPFINISRDIIDNSIIAHEELLQKKLPFIIRRPISNNKSEYWYLRDLEIIN